MRGRSLPRAPRAPPSRTGSSPRTPREPRSLRDEAEAHLPWTETNRMAKATMLGFLLALAMASIVLSLSRGGFIATLLTFLLFSHALVPKSLGGKSRTAMLAGAVTLAVIVLSVAFWLGASA